LKEASQQRSFRRLLQQRSPRSWLLRFLPHPAAAVAFLLVAAIGAAAGTVTGVVHNGTTGKPAAGVDVILIQLQGGMESVANTKTDSQGNYKLDHAAVGGQQPMLIRAIYRGVMFHQPLPPGSATADVTVFEPSSDAKTVKVASRVIVLQPNGSTLLVGEEYALQNQSQPPVAYFNQQGDFNFELPEGAELSQVSSWGPSGMPVVQGTINRGTRRYAIAYAFQPGENGVRLSYQVPYASNQATLRFTSNYPAPRVMLAAPPSVQITSAGFAPASPEQGFNLYARDTMPAGLPFEVSVSGTAPPPAPNQQGPPGATDQGQGQGQGQDQINGRDSGAAVQALPNRLDSLKWILIVGFAALFALGSALIWRRPVPLPTEAVVGGAPPSVRAGPRAPRKQSARPPATAAPTGAPAAQPMSEIDREVSHSLDGLKDSLFRLELRRQAGTISEEDYARERGRAEKILRELVRG
jgi:hypothetical protein